MNPTGEELLFQLALTKPVGERAAWLDRECGSDAALRARLEALLAAHEQPETLLATKVETARPTIKLDLADAPDEAVGQTLGRYKLLERVGEGGCGVVYVAEQTEPVRQGAAHCDQADVAMFGSDGFPNGFEPELVRPRGGPIYLAIIWKRAPVHQSAPESAQKPEKIRNCAKKEENR